MGPVASAAPVPESKGHLLGPQEAGIRDLDAPRRHRQAAAAHYELGEMSPSGGTHTDGHR